MCFWAITVSISWSCLYILLVDLFPHCFVRILFIRGKSRFTVVSTQNSLSLYCYLLIIVLFSIQTTGNLLFWPLFIREISLFSVVWNSEFFPLFIIIYLLALLWYFFYHVEIVKTVNFEFYTSLFSSYTNLLVIF